MGDTHFPSETDYLEMASCVDRTVIPFPHSAISSSIPVSTAPSTTASPAPYTIPLGLADDYQTPAKPSHEYELFKQQTGLPSGSVPGISPYSADPFHDSFLNSPDIGYNDCWGSRLGDVDMDMNNSYSAMFFPDANTSSDCSVNPNAIHGQPQQLRAFPGMHQQQADLAKAQADVQARQQWQQQKHPQNPALQVQRKSVHPFSNWSDDIIADVVNKIRVNSTAASQNADCAPHNPATNTMRMKKDEEDMDEDERLLASEEGKKLSSKERRQLRNKVSARAFRSRRKEYISQLEGELAAKNKESNEIKIELQALREQCARSHDLFQYLLRHPGFSTLLEEFSRDSVLFDPANFTCPTLEQDSRSEISVLTERFIRMPSQQENCILNSSHRVD